MGFLSLCLLSLSRGAPQYSGDQTGALDAGSLDTIAEIFGSSGKQVDAGYGSGQQTGALSDDVDVLVQVIQESNNKIADLEKKRDGAGKYGRIFDAQIQGFQQCTVQWENPAAPLVDVSDFGRTQDEGYGNTETKADNVYPDTSSAVKITQTYTEDTSDLVSAKDTNTYSQDTSDLVSAKDTNTYSQDTSADILEAKAPVY